MSRRLGQRRINRYAGGSIYYIARYRMRKTKQDKRNFITAIVVSLIGFAMLFLAAVIQLAIDNRIIVGAYVLISSAFALGGAIFAMELHSIKWQKIKTSLWEYKWWILGAILFIVFTLIMIPIEERWLGFDTPQKCSDLYGNKTFFDKFDPASDSPYIPYACENNKSDYAQCVRDVDPKAEYFVTHCGWMMPDYIILIGMVVGNMMLVFIIGSIIASLFRPRCTLP